MTNTYDNTHDVIPPHALAPWHAIREAFVTQVSPAFLPAYDAALAHAWEAGENADDFLAVSTKFNACDGPTPTLVFGSIAEGWARHYDAVGLIIKDLARYGYGIEEKAKRWNDEAAAICDLIKASDWDDEMVARSGDRVNALDRRILGLESTDPQIALAKLAAGRRMQSSSDAATDNLLASLQETIKGLIAGEAS